MKIHNHEFLTLQIKEDSLALTKFTFFVFGVSSLSGWNAILTALDYFQE